MLNTKVKKFALLDYVSRLLSSARLLIPRISKLVGSGMALAKEAPPLWLGYSLRIKMKSSISTTPLRVTSPCAREVPVL